MPEFQKIGNSVVHIYIEMPHAQKAEGAVQCPLRYKKRGAVILETLRGIGLTGNVHKSAFYNSKIS